MKTTVMLALGLALLGTSTAAFATTKTHTTTTKTPTHHCQLQGTEVPKSKKACVKAGGTWEPGAPGAKSAAAPAATTK